jgi:hypothetical protein
MDTVRNLSTAIEGLYEAFALYPLPEYTDPCPCCHTAADESMLHSAPLRQLGVSELRDYAGDALLVCGGVAEFKHFLPRIFDLYFNDPESASDFVDAEILFNKFRHGQWLTWPTQEQNAVRIFLHALWADILRDPPPPESFTDVESWLCSIAQAEDDLEPYLLQWLDDQRMSASLALSSMLLSDAGRNPFWDSRDEQCTQFQDWKKSRSVLKKLQEARIESTSVAEKNEFEAALGYLDFTSR